MKLKSNLILILMVLMHPIYAQKFDPNVSEKSLVRVEIKDGNKGYACSGFVWKNQNWVVSSLHAMKNGASYQVVYHNKYYRDAEVYKVYADADLVLLKTNVDEKPLSTPAVPITSFNAEKVAFGTQLYAQGYHGGATGHRVVSLQKGGAKPEILEKLVNKPADLDKLHRLGFPKTDLTVVELMGSLLPGYSGSPVYNLKGELVGIGNGGLENGTINVSWAIPGKYLVDLEKSSTKDLPAGLEDISLLMSSQVEVDLSQSQGNEGDMQKLLEEQYAVYSGGDLEFIQTKNRSFEQMHATAFDPENLSYFAEDLEDNGIIIDYDYIRYDIYEDIDFGVTIAVPEGSSLIYDPVDGVFSAALDNYPLSEYFSLQYFGFVDNDYVIADAEMAASFIKEELENVLGASVNGFSEDQDYTYTLEIDEEREIVYALYNGNSSFYDIYNNEYMLGLYLTVLKDENRIFYSMVSVTIPIYQLAGAFENGINCHENYEGNADYCEFFEQYMRIMAASHLTTFSSKQFANE
jgi:hypothetical protein